ncbi:MULTISPECIES: AIR synthase-related protein [Acidianus]|uniref:AIR synthase n=1 Tax=Candidatus Acidianus copahuensis TaxID=1160895 RepID=A0A031LNM7_9CREN|nr:MULTISPECIES: AIR synthase-related protein [Acidianus]EZQ03159.1 AIR synthase [Candidatus Acidianus copahuensis]NON62225.1 AIR synthase [Acidianus sp. RZ1]
MDLEGLARRLDKQRAKQEILELLEIYKGKNDFNEKLANTIIEEVDLSKIYSYWEPIRVGITSGNAGLGSRGIGDHLIHEKLFELSGKSVDTFDDAGIQEDIAISIDGIHSRLSYYPFLAGFHATKATLRDIMVKGANPLGLIVDIHVSDDTDISYLLDFEAGVSTVADAIGVKILSGSTLRIGGDVVIGERISGGVGAIGKISNKKYLRSNVKKGMKIIMTEGNGGGTIASTAIFHGYHGIVDETLKVDELMACSAILSSENSAEAMTDVTNGGLRMDAIEISEISHVTFRINVDKFFSMINPNVLKMLHDLDIDPLGVSIDSILIFSKDEDILRILSKAGIRSEIIGEVEDFSGSSIIDETGKPIQPKFRESPYTPVKKVIGNISPYTLDELKIKLDIALNEAKMRKDKVLKNLKGTFV